MAVKVKGFFKKNLGLLNFDIQIYILTRLYMHISHTDHLYFTFLPYFPLFHHKIYKVNQNILLFQKINAIIKNDMFI